MSETEIEIEAPPERVWEVLANPHVYDEWVLGAQEVRDADESWPAVGSKLHHRTGVGPLSVDDETEVVQSDRPRRLGLRARARPVGEFSIELELEPTGSGGTRLVMREGADVGFVAHVPGTDASIGARNVLSLRRLKALAEETPTAHR